jgi:DNA-binding ferritin-like protein (Dps family)
MSIAKIAAKVIGEKKRWRDYKARVRKLPEPYRTAVDGFEHYLMVAGGIVDGESAASLFENLADLFEQSAADGTPIREIVGDDPIEFIEAFIRNYPEGDWRNRERQRLIDTINNATGDSRKAGSK